MHQMSGTKSQGMSSDAFVFRLFRRIHAQQLSNSHLCLHPHSTNTRYSAIVQNPVQRAVRVERPRIVTSLRKVVTMRLFNNHMNCASYAQKTYASKKDYAPAGYPLKTMPQTMRHLQILRWVKGPVHRRNDAQPNRSVFKALNGKIVSTSARLGSPA